MISIGILYPGDMGSALGRVLAGAGFRVVTTMAGRSSRTQRLAIEADLTILPSLTDLVQTAQVVFSVVPPAAARDVADSYLQLVHLAADNAVFIDANPIKPASKLELAEQFRPTRVSFVDGAIHGVASQLQKLGTLYLSGSAARRLAELFGNVLRVRFLGDQPGNAASFKMLLGGMSKGLIALFLEMALLAEDIDLGEQLLECYHHFYPGVMAAIDRILPTYPQHATRRADEMIELEQTMRSFGHEPHLVPGIGELIRRVAAVGLAEKPDAQAQRSWSTNEVVKAIHQCKTDQTKPALTIH